MPKPAHVYSNYYTILIIDVPSNGTIVINEQGTSNSHFYSSKLFEEHIGGTSSVIKWNEFTPNTEIKVKPMRLYLYSITKQTDTYTFDQSTTTTATYTTNLNVTFQPD